MSLHICFPVQFPHRWWNMTSTVTTTPITTPLRLGTLIWSAVTRQRTKRYRAAFAGNSKGKKGQFNTIPCFFSDVYYKKSWISPWILSCTVWSGMSIKWFSFERRRGEEINYHTKGSTNGNCCMMLLDPRELINSSLWSFATIEWRFFISLSFLSLLFFFRLVTILYYLNDVDEGGQTAFVIADNSTLNETVR